MKTIRLHQVHDLRLSEGPLPVPGPDEALIRVTAVGICGSDSHWYTEGGIGGVAYPEVDIVVSAIVGRAGLEGTWAALAI